MGEADFGSPTSRGSGPGTAILVSVSVPFHCGFGYVPTAISATVALVPVTGSENWFNSFPTGCPYQLYMGIAREEKQKQKHCGRIYIYI